MIKVINIKNAHRGSIYGGRGSPLGNPFVMLHECDRGAVCDKFDKLFYDTIKKHRNNIIMSRQEKRLFDEVVRIYRLGKQTDRDIHIHCYCKPKRCHLDTVANFINVYLPNTEKSPLI